MGETNDPLEQRLKAHLSRVADTPAPPGLVARASSAADDRKPETGQWFILMGVAIAVAVAVTLLLLVTTGQQTSDVFSNISNGLNQ